MENKTPDNYEKIMEIIGNEKTCVINRAFEFKTDSRQVYYLAVGDYPRNLVEAVDCLKRLNVNRGTIELWSARYCKEYLAEI